jgi:hypothetical protein
MRRKAVAQTQASCGCAFGMALPATAAATRRFQRLREALEDV